MKYEFYKVKLTLYNCDTKKSEPIGSLLDSETSLE